MSDLESNGVAPAGTPTVLGDAPPAPPPPPAPTLGAPVAMPMTSRPRRHRGHGGRLFLAALLGALIGGAIVAGAGVYVVRPMLEKAAVPTSEQTSTPVAAPAIPQTSTIESAAASVLPSVVNLAVEYRYTNGVGSGIILRSDGYILTNYHVVADALRVTVRLGTGDYDAVVVGTDPTSDLAVIKVRRSNLTPARIGDSTGLQIGQGVIAVGSPFGLDKTVTSGIVSALHRSNMIEGADGVTAYTDLIQTDAAINPGNSGGALVDMAGQVVGVNTLIESPSGQLGASQSAGIGFAIPIDFAKEVADQLIAGKRVTHPYLGASALTVTKAFAQYYSLPIDSGALIQQVVPGSPAAQARLEPGDIIVRIGTSAVASSADMFAAMQKAGVGRPVEIEYVRGSLRTTVVVTLIAR